jgi:hypothetical protein
LSDNRTCIWNFIIKYTFKIAKMNTDTKQRIHEKRIIRNNKITLGLVIPPVSLTSSSSTCVSSLYSGSLDPLLSLELLLTEFAVDNETLVCP